MTTRATRRSCLLLLAALLPVPTGAAAADGGPTIREITATDTGRKLSAATSGRVGPRGRDAGNPSLRVWRLAPGEYLLADRLPTNLKTSVVHGADGRTTVELQFDIEAVAAPATTAAQPGRAGTTPAAPVALAAAPHWTWLNQACFTRISNLAGWLDACYVTHRLVGETDARDFYQLEQYGTVGAKPLAKIYDGWLMARRASSSSAMSWIDWSPRGSISGGCQSIGLSIKALGIGISSSGVMCERWDITKWSEAGRFRQQWGCGCIIPFGQPYPNTREIDYMQAVSVPNGGVARWTLSAGFGANGIS